LAVNRYAHPRAVAKSRAKPWKRENGQVFGGYAAKNLAIFSLARRSRATCRR
jgi:hypothetical protein